MSAGNTTSAARARTLERQRMCIELRRMGLGYGEIAAKVGIGRSQAHRLVAAGLAEAKAQVGADAGDLRAEEISRLDGMMASVWPQARKGALSAVDRVLRIMERRAKLLGLDAPEKLAMTDPDGKAARPTRIELVAPDVNRPPADPA